MNYILERILHGRLLCNISISLKYVKNNDEKIIIGTKEKRDTKNIKRRIMLESYAQSNIIGKYHLRSSKILLPNYIEGALELDTNINFSNEKNLVALEQVILKKNPFLRIRTNFDNEEYLKLESNFGDFYLSCDKSLNYIIHENGKSFDEIFSN